MVHMEVTYERTVRCVIACENEFDQGSFVPVKVACNEEDFDMGKHYEAAEAWAVSRGYEVFMVVDEVEMQPATVLAAFDWDAAPTIDPKGEYYPF